MKRLAVLLLLAGSLDGATLLDQGYRQMYNLQFAEAHRTFAEYARQSPSDALGPVSDAAAYLFAEFDRLQILQSEFLTKDDNFLDFRKPDADPGVKLQFEADLGKAQRLCDEQLKRNPGDPSALFATTLRLGLHSDYLALIEKRNMAALSEVKQSRITAEKLLARNPEYYDALHCCRSGELPTKSETSADPVDFARGRRSDGQAGRLRETSPDGRERTLFVALRTRFVSRG